MVGPWALLAQLSFVLVPLSLLVIVLPEFAAHREVTGMAVLVIRHGTKTKRAILLRFVHP